MANDLINVLLIDDDEDDYILTRDLLREIDHQKYKLDWAPSYEKGLELMHSDIYRVYLIDFRLGKHSGLDLLQELIKKGSRKPVIVLAGQQNIGIDLLALKAGASDYLLKSKLDSYNLERSITYAIERTYAYEDIFQKEQKYRTLFESSNDSIFITDKEYNFQDVNQFTLNLLEYTKNEILTLNLSDIFFSEEEYKPFIDALNNRQINIGKELTLKTKSGKKISCLITPGFITDSTNNVKGYQGIIHDISQRKKLEMQLLTNEKMGATDRIVGTIAHEVRNPLNTIVLALSRFKKEHPNEESYNFYTDIIGKSCQRIDQLISQLIESSRPTELNLQLGSINNLLEDTLKLADDRMKLLKIKVVKQYDEHIPLFSFDTEKLTIAFLNIIINSIEAMKPEVGILEIYTMHISQTICITIQDNGKGIPQENLNKLFDPFFTGKKNGMGLGLTSTHTIIKSHHGEISVDSEIGIGTRFTIYFEAS